MKSPFPGMNPFLEGDLWPEVHHELISKIRKLLIPQLGEQYIARIERYVIKDTHAGEDIGIMYPDVEIFEDKVSESLVKYGKSKPPTPPTLTITRTTPIEVRIPTIEIRDKQSNRLITAIEVISPVNKRKPGLAIYLKKKQNLIDNGVNLVEIDLIRRGQRTIQHPQTKTCHYLVASTKANSSKTDIWLLQLAESLPIIPIPLLPTDQAILLDLQQALLEVYQENLMHRSINYSKNPPPPSLAKSEYNSFLKDS